MLTRAQITDAATRLDVAEKSRQQTGLVSLQYPAMDMTDAYAIQSTWVAMQCAAGRMIRGRKNGLTSRAM